MKTAARCSLLGLCVLLASCSSYQRDFQQAVAAAGDTHPGPTGPFVGTWKSVPSGHEGPLWCLISPSSKPGHYDFRYRAGWGLVSFGDYLHTVPVERRRDGSLQVKGAMELPKAVGAYSLDGTVTRDHFDAKYTSTKGDHGTFKLRRPEE